MTVADSSDLQIATVLNRRYTLKLQIIPSFIFPSSEIIS